MDLLEFNTHSFIVKIWLEEPAGEHRRATWRGRITHVPSGERRYLKSLGGILAFIVPYLISMGVKLEAAWRVRHWLRTRRMREPEQADRDAALGDTASAQKQGGD